MPTLDNSDASPANPNGNSNTLSVAINTPPETFPHRSWPRHTSLTPYPSLPNPSQSITTSPERPRPQLIPSEYHCGPTLDCTRHPSTPHSSVDSRHHIRHPLRYPVYELRACTTTRTFLRQLRPLLPTQPRDPSSPGNPLSSSNPAPITREASAYPAIYLRAHELALTPALGQRPVPLGPPHKLSPPPLQLWTPGYKRRTLRPPNPLDPACSFHMQRKEPVGTRNKAPSSVPRQQEELNAASSILRNLNPAGGLFDQPAAHTLALSARPQASSVPSAF
ncbi:hypothetical protein E4T56_gene2759 [Termitomyces sp. T112]|nr:hypothetical protein E4T56_gene2759 [Termitomyces sp. T112]